MRAYAVAWKVVFSNIILSFFGAEASGLETHNIQFTVSNYAILFANLLIRAWKFSKAAERKSPAKQYKRSQSAAPFNAASSQCAAKKNKGSIRQIEKIGT